MYEVEVIKANVNAVNRRSKKSETIRVAAYCRVSTDSDEQAKSYENQVEHYTRYIKEKEG